MTATARWFESHRRKLFLVLVFLVYAGGLVWSDGLRFEPTKDEVHFWETTDGWFLDSFPPSAEALRNYPELITPLSYVIWGRLHWLTGDGIRAGRALHVALSLAIIALLAFPRRGDSKTAEFAAAGLLLYPYFLALSFHLYTDIIGTFFAVFALHAHARGRLLLALLLFTLAICTRQYLVQVPAAVALWEGLRSLRGEDRVKETVVAGLACCTVLVWIAFWGGLAPVPGLDRWTALYPSPMLRPTEFIVAYGNYFLVGLGAYFVVPEMLLTGRRPPRALLRARWAHLVALGLLVAFLIDPPLLSGDQPGGIFGRITRAIIDPVSEPLRIALYYGLALLALLRFAPERGIAFWIVATGCVMSMKSQIPWEKYLLPCLAPLWYLRSRPHRKVGLGAAWEA